MNTTDLEQILQQRPTTSPADSFKSVLLETDYNMLLKSATTFGTPHYLLDLDQLYNRADFFLQTFRQCVPQSDFFYPFKCNDLPLLINTVKKAGFHADVAALFELKLALKLGFEKIVFSSPGKSPEELSCVLKHKKQVILNIDNWDELLLLETLAGAKKTKHKLRVGIRLNSTAGDGQGGVWSKFGFLLDQLKEITHRLHKSPNLEWAGLHFHTSWNKNPQKYVDNIRRVGLFLKENFSPQVVSKLQFLDIGGGFYPPHQAFIHKGEDKGLLLEMIAQAGGNKDEINQEADFDPFAFGITPVQPLETFAREIGAAVQDYILPLNPHIKIYFEPGRFIATPSTSILLKVTAVKSNCVIVDGGINMLGDYKFSEYSFAPVLNVSRPSTQLRRTIIYGPLCDPCDLWGYSYYGEPLQKGDILAVLHQGAYTFATAWRFIKAVPPYIAVTENRFLTAHKQETFAQRYAGCRFEPME